MTEDNTDRRRHPRAKCEGLVTLHIQSGRHRGSLFVGLLNDLSDGGMCVILDGGSFERGTEVVVAFADDLQLQAWVCHCTHTAEFCRLGLSFDSVDGNVPEFCWERERCRFSPVDLD